jgi:hypothetical protein
MNIHSTRDDRTRAHGGLEGDLMLLVRYVLRRPYTVVALLTLIRLLSAGAVTRMPIDILPEINIPVVGAPLTTLFTGNRNFGSGLFTTMLFLFSF